MTVNKLTDEQLSAADGAFSVAFLKNYNRLEAIVAASPFLQFPIAPLTRKEVDTACAYFYAYDDIGGALNNLVDTRNAPPKPDPRKVALMGAGFTKNEADKAIAALDSVAA